MEAGVRHPLPQKIETRCQTPSFFPFLLNDIQPVQRKGGVEAAEGFIALL